MHSTVLNAINSGVQRNSTPLREFTRLPVTLHNVKTTPAIAETTSRQKLKPCLTRLNGKRRQSYSTSQARSCHAACESMGQASVTPATRLLRDGEHLNGSLSVAAAVATDSRDVNVYNAHHAASAWKPVRANTQSSYGVKIKSKITLALTTTETVWTIILILSALLRLAGMILD